MQHVFRSKDAPELGSIFKDEKGNVVGKVAEVFGPVKNPYVLVEMRGGLRGKKMP